MLSPEMLRMSAPFRFLAFRIFSATLSDPLFGKPIELSKDLLR